MDIFAFLFCIFGVAFGAYQKGKTVGYNQGYDDAQRLHTLTSG